MPTIKDVLPYVEEVARTIRSMNGVEAVYVTGSVMSQAETPDYAVKDIDIIVKTTFDSGDLMAIDAGSDSPLKMNMKDLEDFGFNPEAVKFTKAYLAIVSWEPCSEHMPGIPASYPAKQSVHGLHQSICLILH